MMNKTIKTFITSLFLIASAITPAMCANNNEEPVITKKIEFLAFGTGSTTGTYFPLGSAFSEVWTQKSDRINVMAHSTNGSYQNIELLRNHEINLAIAQSDIVNAALNGTGRFQDKKFEDIRILMSLYSEVIQIVVPANSDINTFEDLKKHRINVGPANSGNALTTIELLNALGISDGQYEKIYLSYDEAIQAMEKQECDATIIISGVPTKAIMELKKRIPIRIINIPFTTVAETIKKLPYLSQYTISDDIYGLGKNTSTVAVTALLIANKNLKDDIAYDLLKILFENVDYLKIRHERARDLNPEKALKDINNALLHPGSQKFLQEIKAKSHK